MMKGKYVHVRELTDADAGDLLTLQSDNKSFFERFSMERGSEFYTLAAQLKRINQFKQKMRNDSEYNFGIFENESQHLVGTINLFQIARGSLQSAFIGYFLDKTYNGKGFTTEAVQLLVEYAFNELKLHRIEAGVMPHNIGSIRVLEKSGFHKEGLAKKNVKINGKWEDHQVLAIINPLD
ncbi:GNAT family N-acetyltransferase [Halobacillus sp. BBL2006]|uniref:GNAT family N-acetyltransferase n=1 Tax=Halobacillus sp. BBL2006 TaxID=1543706 RepID=UPI0005419E9C|nr:GNAT family protein [Halobacillus sp. BBL2006]KHE72929.1 alanine acetyltransferase [Halobacillus sp. BBL2006]